MIQQQEKDSDWDFQKNMRVCMQAACLQMQFESAAEQIKTFHRLQLDRFTPKIRGKIITVVK